MRELPSGTVTFLFTDIEGSTGLLYELGGAYAEVLSEHRRCLRKAFAQHQGVEVDTQGDAFFYAFSAAPDAVAAARDGQLAVAGGSVRVRMGLHTGEPLLTEEGYVGIDVHRAARIAACGHGGQVLLSARTRQLLDDSIGVGIRDLGNHRLKDLQEPDRIYQLGVEDFPPLKSLFQTNLPVQPTRFIGRERNIAEVVQLLERGDVRLLTLTGPGGSGKTRLAIQAAAAVVDKRRDGVWFVDLASLSDPGLVVPAIARALGLRDIGPDVWERSLHQHLRDRALLLVMDNLEQLLPEVAVALGTLLSAAAQVQILATSREPLKVAGEHEYPLSVLLRVDAEELFATRARAILPSFDLNGRSRGTVSAICDRLDRLPLAIELAVPWIRSLPLDELLLRLERRLPMLASGARDAPARQRTLMATIEWSHSLLSAEERRLLAWLSVFVGGFRLDAAETVCGAELHTLAALVDKNLLRMDAGRDAPSRYMILDTIHEFAHNRLAESASAGAVREAHAAYFRSLADQAGPHLESPRQAAWVRLLEDERDNLRAAFESTLGRDPRAALRLVVSLKQFWSRSEGGEGREWLLRALAASTERDGLRADGLFMASVWTIFQNRLPVARQLAEEASEIGKAIGSELHVGMALHALAFVVEVERGDHWLDESLSLYEEAESLVRGSVAPWSLALLLNNFGYALYSRGERGKAREKLSEAADIAEQVGDAWLSSGVHGSLADVEMMTGNRAAAKSHWRRELELGVDIRAELRVSEALAGLATLVLEDGKPTHALQLLGAATELFRRTGTWLQSPDTELATETRERAQGLVGAEAAAAAWQQGVDMSLEEAGAFGTSCFEGLSLR